MHVSLIPETLFKFLGVPVTNTLLTSWLVVLVIILLARLVFVSIKDVPGKIQATAEIVIEKFIEFMTTIAGSEDKVRKFLPIVATIFIFILSANWIGILPGVGSIGFTEYDHGKEVFVPLLRSVNSDLNMTIALALLIVTMSHVVGVISIGAKAHIGKFISFKNPAGFFVGILELLSEFSKIISFSFRLFGNVFAGEVLLVIIAFLVPYLAPIPFLGLEIFVGLIQALIFAVLSMMFLSAATVSHEVGHDESHEEAHDGSRGEPKGRSHGTHAKAH